MYVIVHWMLRTDPLRSPVRHSPCVVRVPRVLAYPMRRTSLPSNAVSVFISGTATPVLPVKSLLITAIYPERCSYDLTALHSTVPPGGMLPLTIRPSCPRFNTFLAVFFFSASRYPQALQIKIPYFRLPAPPQTLHSTATPFPGTSTSSTDCSLHFCTRRLRM